MVDSEVKTSSQNPAHTVANDCPRSRGYQRSNARGVVLVKMALHDMRDGDAGKRCFDRIDQVTSMFRRSGCFDQEQPSLV